MQSLPKDDDALENEHGHSLVLEAWVEGVEVGKARLRCMLCHKILYPLPPTKNDVYEWYNGQHCVIDDDLEEIFAN